MKVISAILALSLLSAGSAVVLAQGSTTGTILGAVKDGSGAVLPGVSLTAVHQRTGLTRTVLSNDSGFYEFLQLPVGEYQVRAELEGFQAEAIRVQVTVQSHLTVDIEMSVGQMTDSVIVRTSDETVNATDASLGAVVDNKKVSDLPLNGRNFVDLMGLQPGATPILNTGGGRTSDTRNAGGFVNGADSFFNNFTVDGGDYNDFAVPGSNINKALIGTGISPDAIQEFRVITSNADAEFGTTAGAQVNVVTKSGGNELRGSLWHFHRNDALDARNFFDRGLFFDDRDNDGEFTPGVDKAEAPPFKLNQFGFALGGPIVPKKHFFFGSYEGFRQRLLQTATPLVPTPRLIQALPGGPEFGFLRELYDGFFPDPDPGFDPEALVAPFGTTTNVGNDRDAFVIRTDHILSDVDQINFRFIFNQAEGAPGSILSSGIQGGNLGFDWRNLSPQVSWNHTFSPTLVNEVRVNLNRHRLGVTWDEPPAEVVALGFSPSAADPDGLPFIVAAGTGMANLGVLTSIPQGRVANAYQVNDTLSWVVGQHSVKLGGNVLRLQNNGFGADTPRRQTVFVGFGAPFDDSEVGLTSGNFFTQDQLFHLDPRNSSRRFRRYTHVGLFIQDNWRIRSNLVINLGLRYEYTSPPVEKFDVQNNIFPLDSSGQPIEGGDIGDVREIGLFLADGDNLPLYQRDFNDFAPRVGFAWDPLENQKLVVRGGYGLFYNRPDLFFIGGTANFPFSLPTTLSNQPFGTVADPDEFVELGQPQNISGVDPSNRTTYVNKFNLGIQYTLGWNTVGQVRYVGSRSRNLFRNRLPNFGGGFAGERPNTEFAVISFDEASGRSNYDSLQLEVSRPFQGGLGFQASYTYSKTLDTQPLGSDATDQANLDLDYGFADFDVPHIFVVNYFWELPFGPGQAFLQDGWLSKIFGGWTTSAIVSYVSGQPFSITSGIDSNGDGTNNDRARALTGNPDVILSSGSEQTQFLLPVDQVRDVILSQTDGVALGRNTFRGPSQSNVDFSAVKNILVSERFQVQFRSEFFNLFNKTNLSNPVTSLGSGAFGQIFSTKTNPRQIQFGLKLVF